MSDDLGFGGEDVPKGWTGSEFPPAIDEAAPEHRGHDASGESFAIVKARGLVMLPAGFPMCPSSGVAVLGDGRREMRRRD